MLIHPNLLSAGALPERNHGGYFFRIWTGRRPVLLLGPKGPTSPPWRITVINDIYIVVYIQIAHGQDPKVNPFFFAYYTLAFFALRFLVLRVLTVPITLIFWSRSIQRLLSFQYFSSQASEKGSALIEFSFKLMTTENAQ